MRKGLFNPGSKVQRPFRPTSVPKGTHTPIGEGIIHPAMDDADVGAGWVLPIHNIQLGFLYIGGRYLEPKNLRF